MNKKDYAFDKKDKYPSDMLDLGQNGTYVSIWDPYWPMPNNQKFMIMLEG